jgi:hypothetical protein
MRDVKEDAERGRVYLPRQLLLQHGIAAVAHEHFDAVVCDVFAASRIMPSITRVGMRRSPGLACGHYSSEFTRRIRRVYYARRLPAWRKTAIALRTCGRVRAAVRRAGRGHDIR